MIMMLGAAGIGALGFCVLAVANRLRDRGVESAISRHLAGAFGGVLYLLVVLTLDPGVAVALSAGALALIVGLKFRAGTALRGLQARGTISRWGELAYVAAATASLAIGWLWLGDRWLGFAPIGFMAWGDNAAGLVRAITPRTSAIWPSLAMLAACLCAAVLFQPYWIGAAGAIAATAAERTRAIPSALWDDNWVIVAASLAMMAALLQIN